MFRTEPLLVGGSFRIAACSQANTVWVRLRPSSPKCDVGEGASHGFTGSYDQELILLEEGVWIFGQSGASLGARREIPFPDPFENGHLRRDCGGPGLHRHTSRG